MAGTPKKSSKATGKAKKAAIKAGRASKQAKHEDGAPRPAAESPPKHPAP